MMRAYRMMLFFATAGCLTMIARCPAAGLLIADGGLGGLLEIEEQTVDVTINNGIAVTTVEQTFRNLEDRQVEALYMFPVPQGASVANFSMWIHGKEMVGEVVEKERAREIYESYKIPRRDPGLLEQVDFKSFELRIFPIEAGAQQRIQISYYQQLDFDHDWATYVYPLATDSRRDMDQRTTGRLAVNLHVLSEVPIVKMNSPSHANEMVISKRSDHFYEASLENVEGSIAEDVVISYRTSRPRAGIDLITSRPEGEDGYFMATLTAGDELESMEEPADYVFILDVSGSMSNDGKLGLSRQSLDAFISGLQPEDRFEVMTFHVEPNPLFGDLVAARESHMNQARQFLASQGARGGTELRHAIRTAYRYGDPDRPLNVVVLSDGMTERENRAQLLGLIRAKPANATVFAIGVGNEVDRPLLQQLAEEAGGLADFISRGDHFEQKAAAFRRKLTRPAASDVTIQIEGADVYDMVPAQLPNLYHGAPIRVFGRFRRASESLRVAWSADVRGKPIHRQANLELSHRDNPEIERMWASQRIHHLLRRADRESAREAVADEVVRLGETYSIVTEYTSFIVLENDEEYQRWKIKRRNVNRLGRDRDRRLELNRDLERMRQDALKGLGPDIARKEKSQSNSPSSPFHVSSGGTSTPEPSASVLMLMASGWTLLVFRRRLWRSSVRGKAGGFML